MSTPSAGFYIAIFSLSLILSLLLIPLLRKIALKYSIVDVPNQPHKTHEKSIPYLGGFSIILPTMILGMFSSYFLIDSTEYVNWILLLMWPAILISLLGLFDDIANLSAGFRFFFQVFVSIGVSWYLHSIGYAVLMFESQIANHVLTIFWLVGIINAFNFFDNIDGGVAGITIIASITLCVLSILGSQYLIASVALALAGSSLGFLYWNLNPAQIYLGDSGALFIGFLMATMLLRFEPETGSQLSARLMPVLILALPIVDTTVAVASRLLRGISILQGGRDHIAHRLINLKMTKSSAVYVIWSLAVIFSIISLSLTYLTPSLATALGLFGVALMLICVLFFLKIE